MSKMDGLRAMREARYQEAAARAKKPTSAPAAPARPARRVTASKPVAAEVEETADTTAALCGHRAISGRTCTREQGHAAKSHRYS